jgi:hypothetical protein
MTFPIITNVEVPTYAVTQLIDPPNPPKKIRKKRAPKHDFKDGLGRVAAHRHDNGRGWIADTAKVEDSVYVGTGCEIFQNAIVRGNVRLQGNSRIFGGAAVSGAVLLQKEAAIYGKAVVRDQTTLTDTVRLFGEAHVSGTSSLYSNSFVCDSAHVFSTSLHGDCQIRGSALLVRSTLHGGNGGNNGFIEIKGNAALIHATVQGHVSVAGSAQILRSNIRNHFSTVATKLSECVIVSDESYIYVPVVLEHHAVIIRSQLYQQHTEPQFPNSDDGHVHIAGRTVIQQQTLNSRAALQNYLNAFAMNSRFGPAQVLPNGQLTQTIVRNWDQATPQRRIMRLQEATP